MYIRLAFQSENEVQGRSATAGGSMRGATGMKKITAKAGWGALQVKTATDHKLRKAQGGCDCLFRTTSNSFSHESNIDCHRGAGVPGDITSVLGLWKKGGVGMKKRMGAVFGRVKLYGRPCYVSCV